MRQRALTAVCGVVVSSVLLAKNAIADEDDCRGPGGAVVLVAFTGPWPPRLRTGVLEHLRAGLGPTGFRVCDEDAAPGAAKVATVELRQNPGERVTATIEVRDGVTEKRVARDIDLSALPADARALGVGVAADELLRASWIELSLSGAPKPSRPPPPAVRKTVEASLRVERPSRSEASLEGAVEGHTSGLLLFGGDLAFQHSLDEVLGIGVSLGVRQSGSEASAHGTITATLFGAAANVFVDVAHAGRLRVFVEAGASVSEVRLRGRARAGSEGTEASSVAVVVRAGAGVTYRVVGPVCVTARGGGGVPLRAVVARDYGSSGPGVSGFEWFAALGPGVSF